MRIVETNEPGFVYQVDLIDEDGGYHTVFTGPDATSSCPGELLVSFPQTEYFARGARIYTQAPGWEQIDAVEVSGLVPNDGMQFGVRAALDGNTALVNTSNVDEARGAAYVFVRSGGIWEQRARLQPSDLEPWDQAGTLALSGDRAALGVPLHGPSGAVYVFVRNGDAWTEQQKLVASAPGLSQLGWSVALDNDTLAAAAHRGGVYVFARTGQTWSEQAVLPRAERVALDGDTLLLGRPNGRDGVHVYRRMAGAWSMTATLAPSLPGEVGFGKNIAISGETAAVNSNGHVYLFERRGQGWFEEAVLAPAEPRVLGVGVDIDGDVLAFGIRTKQWHNVPGEVYVSTRSGGGWSQPVLVLPSGSTLNDLFAATDSVGVSGDTIIAGAHYLTDPDVVATHTGAAYVFRVDIDGDGVAIDNCPTVPNPNQTDSNGDGYGDACVPAGATIGPGATIGSGTKFGDGVSVGDDANIGSNVNVKADVTAGDSLVVGDDSEIGRDATLGDNVKIGTNVTIQRDVTIGSNVTIGNNTTIKTDAVIGSDVTILDGVVVGREATVLSGATVPAGIVIAPGATYPPA
jgi:acetyltransferase-like isoleucine patch superfamily enzyme